MEFKRTLITPSLAKQILEKNIKNRRIKQPTIDRYVKDMIIGKWKEDTAEVIKISKSGVVLDGQHRLTALIKANINLFFHIAYDIDDSVYTVLDSGSLRSSSDSFKIEGIKLSNIVPSIINTHDQLIKNKIHLKRKDLCTDSLLEIYYQRQRFWDDTSNKSINWYQNFSKILSPSIIGGVYARIYDINEDKAFKFMNELCTGSEITNNTILLLRQKLISDKLSQRRLSTENKLALIIKTWLFYKDNKEPKILKFDSNIEETPIIK
jgi:hypothetical protein